MPDLWPWGIAETCFAVAIGATMKWVEAHLLLKEEQKKVASLEIEIAALKSANSEKSKSSTDEFMKPLKYPKIYNA